MIVSIIMKIVVDTEEIFGLHDAAKELKIGIATLCRWMKAGRVTPLRIGGRTYIPKSEVTRLNAARNASASAGRDAG